MWNTLGDKCLIEVTTALVYGGRQAPLLSFPPLGGFAVTYGATAVLLVAPFYLFFDTTCYSCFLADNDCPGRTGQWAVCAI